MSGKQIVKDTINGKVDLTEVRFYLIQSMLKIDEKLRKKVKALLET